MKYLIEFETEERKDFALISMANQAFEICIKCRCEDCLSKIFIFATLRPKMSDKLDSKYGPKLSEASKFITDVIKLLEDFVK